MDAASSFVQTAGMQSEPENSLSSLKAQLEEEQVDLTALAAYLDSLPADQRWTELSQLNRSQQRRLYELAETAEPIDLRYFVPSTDRLAPVHHRGRNTLPLPGRYRHFEKRFCLPEQGEQRLFGYNHGPTTGWMGPGYFVALSTEQRPEWQERGSVVIDYFQVPDAEVAEDWPQVVPNEKGLQKFVYKGTRDFMRKVSDHVSIGAAYKGEKALDHYFVLCREEAS